MTITISKVRLARLAATALLALLGTGNASAKHRKLATELTDQVVEHQALQSQTSQAQAASGPLVDVIIQFRPGAKLDQGILRVTGAGGQHRNRLEIINGGVFRVPADLLPALADDPEVTYISPDRKNIKLSPDDFILDSTSTNPILQLGYSGVGVGIAVIDSGVKSSHPDFANSYGNSRVVYSQSFIPGLDASDQYGHGTQVAGLIAGNGNASGGWMRGAAPRANIINLRVLDAIGAGTDSAVISAIQR